MFWLLAVLYWVPKVLLDFISGLGEIEVILISGFPEILGVADIKEVLMPKTKCIQNLQHPQDNEKQLLLANFCKALGHPIRVEIVKILLEKGECISGDLAESFNKAHSTISEHLKILKDANLVLGTIDGPKRCYCVNPKALKQMKKLINLLVFDPECCKPSSNDGDNDGVF